MTASNTAAIAVGDRSENSGLAFEMQLRTRSRYQCMSKYFFGTFV